MERLFDIMVEYFPEDKDYDKLYRETYASKPDIQLHNMEKRHQMQLRKMDKLHAREIDGFYVEYSSKKLRPDNSILEKCYAQFSESVKLINGVGSRSIIVIDDNDAKEEEYHTDITNINNFTRSNATTYNKILDSNDDNIFFVGETYKAIQNEYSNMRKAQFFLFDTLSYSHENEKNIILKRSNKTDLKSKQITNVQENSNALPRQANLNTTVISNDTKLVNKTVYSSTPSSAGNKKFDIDASNGWFQLCGKSNDKTNGTISDVTSNKINNNSNSYNKNKNKNKNNTLPMDSVLYTSNNYHETNNCKIVGNNVSLQLQTNGALSANDPVPLKQQMLASVIVDYLDTSNSTPPSWTSDLLRKINSSNNIDGFDNINLPMTWAQLIPLMNRVDTSGLETYYHESKDPRVGRQKESKYR